MDLNRLTTGDKVLVISAAVFLLAMFLPWYSAGGGFESLSRSGWSFFFFGVIPLLLLLAAAASVFVLRFAENVTIPDLPLPLSQVVLIASAIAAVLVLLKVLIGDEVNGFDLDRQFGIILALLAGGGVCVGAYLNMQQGDDAASPGSTPPQPF